MYVLLDVFLRGMEAVAHLFAMLIVFGGCAMMLLPIILLAVLLL